MEVKNIFYRLLILVACWIRVSNGYTQSEDEKVNWLKQHSVPVQGGNFTDKSTIAYLDKALAGKQIVLLGEQNHGDGTTFQLYSQLVKLLHHRYGFEVIIFESGLYDCHKAWQQITGGEDPFTAFRSSIFGVWTNSKQAQPLFKYLKDQASTDTPLRVAGFDCQLTGRYGMEYFLKDLDSLIYRVSPAYFGTSDYRNFRKTVSTVTVYNQPLPVISPDEMVAFEKNHSRITALLNRTKNKEHAFWIQLLESFSAEVDNKQGYIQVEKGEMSAQDLNNARDKQMADNAI